MHVTIGGLDLEDMKKLDEAATAVGTSRDRFAYDLFTAALADLKKKTKKEVK